MRTKTKPTSEKQIAANRRNALKSTGPISLAGRAVCSQNARKYQLLPQENPELPPQLTAEYYRRFAPGNPNERRLVDIMVFSERILRNFPRPESLLCAVESGPRRRRETPRSPALVLELRDSAECAHRNALSQLKAIRTQAA